MPNLNPILIAQQQPLGSFVDTADKISKFTPSDPLESFTRIEELFSAILGFLTIIAGLAFLIYFVIGALSWVTAGGDTKKVDDAKHYMTNGAIGMIIIVAAYSIIWIVGAVLGFDILNPSSTLSTIVNSPF